MVPMAGTPGALGPPFIPSPNFAQALFGSFLSGINQNPVVFRGNGELHTFKVGLLGSMWVYVRWLYSRSSGWCTAASSGPLGKGRAP